MQAASAGAGGRLPHLWCGAGAGGQHDRFCRWLQGGCSCTAWTSTFTPTSWTRRTSSGSTRYNAPQRSQSCCQCSPAQTCHGVSGRGTEFRKGGDFGREEFRGELFAVKKRGEPPPPPHRGEIFAACDQQFHCEFRCRWIRSPPGNNRDHPEPTRKNRNHPQPTRK